MLMVLIIAVLLLFGCVLLSFIVPHPITWLMAVVLALLIACVFLPKYQAQKQLAIQGVWVRAQVVEVRQWERKEGDGHFKTQYEVIAQWTHPNSGKMHQFVSHPWVTAPRVKQGDDVAVQVVLAQPRQYQMDEANF